MGKANYWNYRVITDGENYWISEVYYDKSGHVEGYTGPITEDLKYDRYEDLTTTIRLITFALDRPVLRLQKNGQLTDDTAAQIREAAQ